MTRIQTVAVEPIPVPPDLTSAVVLIADSDPQHVLALQQQLQAGGYTVLIAQTGQQALDQVSQKHPDLLLLDSHLCDTNGHPLYQRIKADDSPGFLPIILITDGESDNPTPAQADAMLAKPIDTHELTIWLTALLRTQQQIEREKQKLAAASQEIEDLKTNIITNVSHELRTPLVQVKAAVSLLVEDVMAQNDSREQPSVAEMALQAVARLESAIENIRQLAQIQQIRLSPVTVTDAVNLAVRNLKRSWESRGAEHRIELHIEDDLPPVLGDKRAIGHLLQLLLDNALKFSPDNSTVKILGHRESGNKILVGVQDFGIGIPKAEHDRIFEPFYQIDGSPTRRYGGTGTGLALATLLAKGMNTHIQLKSRPNQGSTFWVLLPIADLKKYEDH